MNGQTDIVTDEIHLIAIHHKSHDSGTGSR